MIGDCFAAVVVEKLSQRDLAEMDSADQQEKIENERLLQIIS